jgi:serine/threonine-protein kinase
VARIGAGMLAALGAAHRGGVVHRDLKPENVLIAPGDVAKVVDFGMAKAFGTRAAAGGGSGTKLGGTPRYASPELALGKDVGAAADIYSAGLIVFEMLAGRPVFESATAVGYLTQHASAPPPDLAKLAPGAPAEVVALVMKALSKEPSERPDVETFRQALASLVPARKPLSSAPKRPPSSKGPSA